MMTRPFFALCLFAALATCYSETLNARQNPVFNTFNEPIDFGAITADDLSEAAGIVMENADKIIEDIVEVPDGDRTFENTMVALDDLYNEISRISCVTQLFSAAHPDSLVRATAQMLDTEVSKFYNEISLNESLYKAIKAYSLSEEAAGLEGWKAKWVRDEINDLERNGFALQAEDRVKLKKIKDEISVIRDAFTGNLNNYEKYMFLTEAEMEGLSEEYKQARLQEDGTYKIGVSYPDVREFFRTSTNGPARRQLLLNFTNRAADKNMNVLKQLVIKRTEYANLLGYDTYSDYILGDRMADSPETVAAFHRELQQLVTPKAKADIEEMVSFQKEKLGIDNDVVEHWWRGYVIDNLLQQEYGLDVMQIREYFPLDNVLEGLFSITQNLFDLEYREMKDASVWHEDVRAFEVFDNGQIIGRFYLDLYPRPNKYNHAACFPVIIAKKTRQGFQIPTSSLECNFARASEGKPALMTHGEVTTLFHEFGHVLHSLVSKSELMAQSGFYVSQDFVEAPSQIFENWVWDYDALALFAKHHETGEVLPRELYDKMLAAKNVMSGRNALYQIFLGSLDMTLYGGFDVNGPVSITEMREGLDKEINLLDPFEGSHMSASFGHLNDYGSSYYGYLWSKVFAQDMFSRFEEEGIFSKDAGLDYKNIILAQGASRDEMDMLREFLGRDPNKEAFIRSLGL